MLKLSQIIPVHFTSVVGRNPSEARPHGTPTRVSWWQWRGRIIRHRAVAI